MFWIFRNKMDFHWKIKKMVQISKRFDIISDFGLRSDFCIFHHVMMCLHLLSGLFLVTKKSGDPNKPQKPLNEISCIYGLFSGTILVLILVGVGLVLSWIHKWLFSNNKRTWLHRRWCLSSWWKLQRLVFIFQILEIWRILNFWIPII